LRIEAGGCRALWERFGMHPLRDTEGLRESRSVRVGGFIRHEWITQQPTVAMGPTAAERLVGLVVVSCLDRLQGRPCGYSGNDL